MAVVWNKTNFLGIRYREHATRKHGIRPDRCFSMRYKLGGKDKEEVAGWASEGMTAEKAFALLSSLREAARTGQGQLTMQEKRDKSTAAREVAAEVAAQDAKNAMTVRQFWDAVYVPKALVEKADMTRKGEHINFDKWLAPVLADMPMRDVDSSHLDTIRLVAKKAGKQPDTIRKILAVFSQMWNLATTKTGGRIVSGENPCTVLKREKNIGKKGKTKSSQRQRYLTKEEASKILMALQSRSPDMYDYAVLSLYCGLRAGEIHKLTWADVNFSGDNIFIKDTKTDTNRFAFMTSEVREVFQKRYHNQPKAALVFPTKEGKQRVYLPNVFERVVKELALNEGITDPRQKVVFHTLRHTFASWLVQAGTPLYLVAELMGHSSIRMTERYAHNDKDLIKASTQHLEGILKQAKRLSFKKTAD